MLPSWGTRRSNHQQQQQQCIIKSLKFNAQSMKFNEISMKINQNVELLGFIDFTGNFIDFHGLMHYNKILIIGIS